MYGDGEPTGLTFTDLAERTRLFRELVASGIARIHGLSRLDDGTTTVRLAVNDAPTVTAGTPAHTAYAKTIGDRLEAWRTS